MSKTPPHHLDPYFSNRHDPPSHLTPRLLFGNQQELDYVAKLITILAFLLLLLRWTYS